MATDPYKTLGVARTASADEIRKAYRKLAKELHPDLHPGDAKAADRFKEVTAAYDLLGDPQKRARYDKGEIDESGQERPQQRFYREYADSGGAQRYSSSAGFEDFGDVSDLFADLFKRARAGRGGGGGSAEGQTVRIRGQDVRYRLEVDFLEAVTGGKRRMTLPHGNTLDVTLPEGVADGQVLRLRGKGMAGIGGAPSGDALIEIGVRPHPIFTREGDDILVELPITLDEAALGAKVETPTITGTVSLTIPKGAANGQTLRLRGKGVKHARGDGHGDQLVRLRVEMPPKIDDELATFLSDWRERHRYDPRARMKDRK